MFIPLQIYKDSSDNRCSIYLNVSKLNNIDITTMAKIWKLFEPVYKFSNTWLIRRNQKNRKESKRIESQDHIYRTFSDEYIINIRNLQQFNLINIIYNQIRFFLIENHANVIFLIFVTLSTYFILVDIAWETPQSITNRRNTGRRRGGRRKTDMVHLAWTVPHIPLTEFPCYVSLWTFWLYRTKKARLN